MFCFVIFGLIGYCLVEEAPSVYKDIDEVVMVSDKVGLGKLVVRVKSVLVTIIILFVKPLS